jgi:hypothetical protein
MDQKLSVGRSIHLAFALETTANGVCEPYEGTSSQPDVTTDGDGDGNRAHIVAASSLNILSSMCLLIFALLNV